MKRQAPEVLRRISDAQESKRWHDNGQDRVLEILADHGAFEDLTHGLRTSSKVSETWSIDRTNISRASVRIIWDRTLTRDEIHVRTKLDTKMASDSKHYHIEAKLQAFLDEACIFETEFSDSISRNITQSSEQENQKGS